MVYDLPASLFDGVPVPLAGNPSEMLVLTCPARAGISLPTTYARPCLGQAGGHRETLRLVPLPPDPDPEPAPLSQTTTPGGVGIEILNIPLASTDVPGAWCLSAPPPPAGAAGHSAGRELAE